MLKDDLTKRRDAACKKLYAADETAAANFIRTLPEMLQGVADGGWSYMSVPFTYSTAVADRVTMWLETEGLDHRIENGMLTVRGW